MKIYTDLNNRHSEVLLDRANKNVDINTVFLYYSNAFKDEPSKTFYNLKVIGITPYINKSINKAYLSEDKLLISTKSKINEDVHKVLKEMGISDNRIKRSVVEEDGESYYKYKITYLEKYAHAYKSVAPKWNGRPDEVTVENIFPNRGRFIYLGHYRNMDNYDVFTSLGIKYIPAMLRKTLAFDSASGVVVKYPADAGDSIMVLEDTHFITSFLTSKELKRLARLIKGTPFRVSSADEDEAVKVIQDIVRVSHHKLFRNVMYTVHTLGIKDIKKRLIAKELLNITKGEVYLLIMKRIDSIIGLTEEEKITARVLTRLIVKHSSTEMLSDREIADYIIKGIKEALR